MLRFYTDENVEIVIAEGLKRRNIDTISANEVNNLGLSDIEQLEYAVSIKACLFTYDTDFFQIAKIWATKGKTHWGIFYIHPQKTTIGYCIQKLKEYAELYNIEETKNRIIFL
ncbi:DUF5615 family PIN-like protein [candidate division KSB1 bacterium]|nr:DUF5615 family PIN-like protein [candidate division KSB1 bacterium]